MWPKCCCFYLIGSFSDDGSYRTRDFLMFLYLESLNSMSVLVQVYYFGGLAQEPSISITSQHFNVDLQVNQHYWWRWFAVESGLDVAKGTSDDILDIVLNVTNTQTAKINVFHFWRNFISQKLWKANKILCNNFKSWWHHMTITDCLFNVDFWEPS